MIVSIWRAQGTQIAMGILGLALLMHFSNALGLVPQHKAHLVVLATALFGGLLFLLAFMRDHQVIKHADRFAWTEREWHTWANVQEPGLPIAPITTATIFQPDPRAQALGVEDKELWYWTGGEHVLDDDHELDDTDLRGLNDTRLS
jgi:hypothetical protein